ncbi:SRPBCC family protein [Asticcacaulis sp.]|uniref:SRPBCC family protein n=1 Tax=Asticcacaulis sp. TaxID=1872648 RepID=UPI002C0EE001|nr:SRPBCC family protein [Asticcacaulis sp.]HTM80507.1 SRPBCC family protein [Asticcacaulis sp.]
MIMLIIILVLAALLTFLFVVVSKPNHFRMQRSVTINAPAQTVYGHIDDFRQWKDWSPWEQLDPELKRTFSGETSGVGAVYDWQGNGKAGQGRMTIREAAPAHRLLINLDFIKPIAATNSAEFLLQPVSGSGGEDTVVTWAMFGPSPFMSKLMGTVMNMDDLIGKDFERGLENLKRLSEKPTT